ncbi:alkaline protease 1-like [Lingula anatina]|uniref:Alkaline protease 1-like n=1 Tax=Lingula anatina TaxID=7574 RepID=A0A1S3JY49_LINAN|nr:alkaline protease 1-like [Lingula anatina]|eukprot:XP_013415308.1 alkaline protease 1-like [Lingula anatina]
MNDDTQMYTSCNIHDPALSVNTIVDCISDLRVPLIEYMDLSGIPGQYIARLLPDATHVRSGNLDDLRQLTDAIGEIEEDIELLVATKYCKEYNNGNGSYNWGLDTLDGNSYDAKYDIWGDGKGIDVYVADTGINPNHEDLRGRVTIGWPTSTSVDNHGHGTQVASIIGGTNCGVAKRANIISLKVCSNDRCDVSDILEGCLWAKQRVQSTGRLSVINFSFGGTFSRSMNDAVDDLLAAGIPAIAAAGSSNEDACYVSPASTPNTLTVGAFNEEFKKNYFSNYGPCVDIYAPGANIKVADFSGNNTYTLMDGTSIAASFVTGAAAALLQVLRDKGTICSPSAQVVNYTNEYIIENALLGRLTGVGEANLALSTLCLDY